MKKTYILSHSDKFGTHKEIIDFINTCRFISTWRKELPNTYFIVSEASANEICQDIKERHVKASGAAYLLAELNQNCQGLLEPRSWAVINEHKLPPKDPVQVPNQK